MSLYEKTNRKLRSICKISKIEHLAELIFKSLEVLFNKFFPDKKGAQFIASTNYYTGKTFD